MGSLGISERRASRRATRPARRRLAAPRWIAALLLATACEAGGLFGSGNDGPPNEGPGGPTARRLTAVSGDAQEDSVAATLGEPYVVRLTDAHGRPLSGVELTWVVTEGGGTVSESRTVTDANGLASVVATLGTVPGNHAVTVAPPSGTGSAFTFCSQAHHATPVQLLFVADASDAAMGAPIAPAMRLVLRDRFGNLADRVNGTARIALAPGTGTPLASAYGTLETALRDGTATFSDVRVDLPGTAYRLRVDGGGRSTESRPFDVRLLDPAPGAGPGAR